MKRKSTGSEDEDGGEDKRFKHTNGHIPRTPLTDSNAG